MIADRRSDDKRIDRIEQKLNELCVSNSEIRQRQIEKTIPGIESANTKIDSLEKALHGNDDTGSPGLVAEHNTCQHRIRTLEAMVYWLIGIGTLQVGALLVWIGQIDSSVKHLADIITKITGG